MSEKKFASDHTRVFSVVPSEDEPAGIGEESTESYVIFPSDSEDFGTRVETSNELKALSRLQDLLLERGVDADLDSLARSAAVRVHTAAIGGRRTVLCARSQRGAVVVNDHPISSEEEHRRVAELVDDVAALTGLLESPLECTTVCIRDRRAYFVIEDGEWIALRAHEPHEIGVVLRAVERLTEAPRPANPTR